MTNNINWANRSVKAGFVGYSQVTPVYLQNFANQPNYTPIQQKSILAGLSDRAGIDEPAFVDEKPFAYKLMEETGVDNVEVIQVNATNATDDLKNIQSLTEPPQKDETKEVLINGALVVIGVIILVKLLS
jgi:hypothetical protein